MTLIFYRKRKVNKEARSVVGTFMGLDLLLSSLGIAWFSVPEERVWSFAALDLGALSLLL